MKGLERIGGGDEREVGGVGKREDLKQTEVKIIRGKYINYLIPPL